MTVANAGSVRVAARRLYLAPSTVSDHLRELEAELGVPLFERDARRLRLSRAGQRFLPQAERILAHVHEAQEDLWAFQQGVPLLISIGVSPIIATTVLPRFMHHLVQREPTLDVRLRVESSEQLADLVRRNEVDVAFSRLPADAPGLTTYELQRERVMLVANNEGADHDSPAPALDDVLPRMPLLTDNHPGYWPELLARLRRMRLVGRTIAVQRTDVAKRFVEEGLGVSFLPASTVRRELTEGRLVEVQTPTLQLPQAATYLIVPARSNHPGIDVTRALAKELWGSSVRVVGGRQK